MTDAVHPEPLNEAEIADWATDSKPAYKIAAGIARSIRSGMLEPGAATDSNNALARQHDCSPSAAASAKTLLASRGLLRKQGQYYVVTSDSS